MFRKLRRWLFRKGGLLAIFAIAGCVVADITLPHQHLPWRTLNPDAPVGAATQFQLFRLTLSPSQTCMDMAEKAATFNSSKAPPNDGPGLCGWKIARLVKGSSSARLAGAADMQCPLSVGTYIWLREVDELAQKRFGSGVKSVTHFGTYSCRRQNGNSSGKWSEHAYGNAWDVSGFVLDNGVKISIQKHWSKGTSDQRRFLRDARDKACGIFRVTLSPDFNAAHHDHFHFDMGPGNSCR